MVPSERINALTKGPTRLVASFPKQCQVPKHHVSLKNLTVQKMIVSVNFFMLSPLVCLHMMIW
jgi:hypothetical protein